jgi:hypothetical protein
MSISKTTVLQTPFVSQQKRSNHERISSLVQPLKHADDEEYIISPLRLRLARIINIIVVVTWLAGLLLYFV